MRLEHTILEQQTEIRDLRAADRRRHAQLIEALTLLKTLQTQMVALQSQQRPARDPAHPDVPDEANRKHPELEPPPPLPLPPPPMTDAAIRELISQGVADALAEHKIQRNNNLNGDGSQGSRSGIERPVRPTHEFTYTNFLKCQPMNFKVTEGVIVGHDAAYDVPWNTLMKMMTAMYCPRNKIKKLEMEI
nr:hypothetical protein [Tanacetum cinerariifolium]